jgi:hypothetical protein
LSLYEKYRIIESVLNECLGLYNKPKAEVHPGHKLTGPKLEEEEEHALAYAKANVIILYVCKAG